MKIFRKSSENRRSNRFYAHTDFDPKYLILANESQWVIVQSYKSNFSYKSSRGILTSDFGVPQILDPEVPKIQGPQNWILGYLKIQIVLKPIDFWKLQIARVANITYL